MYLSSLPRMYAKWHMLISFLAMQCVFRTDLPVGVGKFPSRFEDKKPDSISYLLQKIDHNKLPKK